MRGSYSPELDNIDIFLSPTKALQRMANIYERDGIELGLKDSAFQAVRESWVAAVFLLGYSQITNQQYWLRENPIKNEAPDIFAITPKDPLPGQKGARREVLEIEVCEYDEHAKTDIPTHIEEKLKDTSYHSETFLLCYVHVTGLSIKLIDVISSLKNLKTGVREIWLLFHVDGKERINFVIARVYLRGADLNTLNLQFQGDYLELSKIPQREMITTTLGIEKKVEFTHLGQGYVPLPVKKTGK